MYQNEPRRSNARTSNKRFETNCPYHVRNPAGFGNPLFTEEALFAWAFQRWVLLFKYLQEIEVAYQ